MRALYNEQSETKNASSRLKSCAGNALGMLTLSAVFIGLGHLQELSNNKEDLRLMDNMTQEQASIIIEAAKSETCSIIHPRFQRLCIKEDNEKILSNPTPEI